MSDSDLVGAIDDRVRLKIGNEEVLISESYEVRMSVLTVPSIFHLKLGDGRAILELIDSYPPNTPFELSIGNVVQFRGRIDAFESSAGSGGGSFTLRGRDHMAPLVDGFVRAERSWTNVTYAQLAEDCLDATVQATTVLKYDADADRSIRCGTKIKGRGKRGVVSVATTKQKSVQAKIGERYYDGILKPQLDRAGLHMRASAENDYTFILDTVHADLPPVAKLINQRGAYPNAVNVLSSSFKLDTTTRYTDYEIYGRGGGKKSGITKAHGSFVDEEMKLLGYRNRFFCHRDEKVSTDAEGLAMARKVAADHRRHSFHLSYQVQGHTVTGLTGKRVVWTPDTVIEVDDQENGLFGPFWLESVTMTRSGSGTTSDLTLMRPGDLVFGSEPAPPQVAAGRPGGYVSSWLINASRGNKAAIEKLSKASQKQIIDESLRVAQLVKQGFKL